MKKIELEDYECIVDGIVFGVDFERSTEGDWKITLVTIEGQDLSSPEHWAFKGKPLLELLQDDAADRLKDAEDETEEEEAEEEDEE